MFYVQALFFIELSIVAIFIHFSFFCCLGYLVTSELMHYDCTIRFVNSCGRFNLPQSKMTSCLYRGHAHPNLRHWHNKKLVDWRVAIRRIYLIGKGVMYLNFELIGASLSEPHINGTSMRAVFILWILVRTSVTRAPLHTFSTKAACNVLG